MGKPVQGQAQSTAKRRAEKVIGDGKNLKALIEPGRWRDNKGEVRGLYLQVAHANNRSWILRYERDGRERQLGLGPFPLVSLKEARERACKARLRLLDGHDPLQLKRDQKAAVEAASTKPLTFEQAARRWWNEHKPKWKNAKVQDQILQSLVDHAFPVIGKLPVERIDTAAVLGVLKPIWHAKTTTADRVRARIEAVLGWATVHGYRMGENAAKWRGHLKEALPAHRNIAPVKHHPALPYAEIPEFMRALRAHASIATSALEFCILTAARNDEVISATWNEIDFDEKVWTVPKERMKGGREHRVPLSSRAVELLRSLPRESGNHHVFIGAKRPKTGLGRLTMSVLLRRLRHSHGDQWRDADGRLVTIHGFRSTFRDWSGNETHFQREVCEAALAHMVGNRVEQAYRRSHALEKRRELMGAWAAFCAGDTHRGVLPRHP